MSRTWYVRFGAEPNAAFQKLEAKRWVLCEMNGSEWFEFKDADNETVALFNPRDVTMIGRGDPIEEKPKKKGKA